MAEENDILATLENQGAKIIGKRVRAIFEMFDQDGDELINMDELREIFR